MTKPKVQPREVEDLLAETREERIKYGRIVVPITDLEAAYVRLARAEAKLRRIRSSVLLQGVKALQDADTIDAVDAEKPRLTVGRTTFPRIKSREYYVAKTTQIVLDSVVETIDDVSKEVDRETF